MPHQPDVLLSGAPIIQKAHLFPRNRAEIPLILYLRPLVSNNIGLFFPNLGAAMKNQRFHDWALYAIFCCHAFLSKTCAGCYFPNGTDRNAFEVTDIYQPCDPGDADSMCCALNRQDPDKCRSDGLCYSLFDGNIWRESCTDRSWKSSKCLKLCDAGIGKGAPSRRGLRILLMTYGM